MINGSPHLRCNDVEHLILGLGDTDFKAEKGTESELYSSVPQTCLCEIMHRPVLGEAHVRKRSSCLLSRGRAAVEKQIYEICMQADINSGGGGDKHSYSYVEANAWQSYVHLGGRFMCLQV